MNSDGMREQVRALLGKHLAREAGPEEVARAVMQRFEAAYVKGDIEGIVTCFAPDVAWRLPTGQLLQGREATRTFLKARLADPAGPRFSDSRLTFFGDAVVQNYRVSVTLPGGTVRELDGCDFYRIRDGLIATKDAYWKQIGAAAANPAPDNGSPQSLVVPLRVSSAADVSRLGQVVKRLAASPALAQACANGALKIEVSVHPGADGTASADGACCKACANGDACACIAQNEMPSERAVVAAAPSTSLLRGVVTERDIKMLPENCTSVGAAPGAVITPLARDSLRQRGIALLSNKRT